ncbi:MAG: 30S ribosomal protein S20 [Patescibacteria group bacterium]|jgi:small subunit ribosomal protein S20
MPIKKAAMKALKQSKTRADRNANIKKNLRDLVKKSKTLVEKKEKEASEKVKEAIKAIDKAVQKKILKKNTGARKKSRLMKKLNSMLK